MSTEREVGIEIAVRGSRRGPARDRKSPFTGELESYAELEMNDEEYRAAAAILARHGKIDEHGEGRLELPTAQIEVWGFDYDGCMMTLVGDLQQACDFLFELATSANLIVQFEAAPGAPSALVTTSELLNRTATLDDSAQEELGPIVLVPNATTLWRAIARPDAQPRGIA